MSLQIIHHYNLYIFVCIILVAPLIARHFKPPATNLPLNSRGQIPPNVTIDVGQDAIVANGTTVLIRCNSTQVSDYLMLCEVLSFFMIQ